MLRGREPVVDDRLELVGRHAGVRRHDDLDERLLAAGERAPSCRPRAATANGSFVLPLRMLRRERLDAVEREGELEVHRLLAPERAVVVERRRCARRRARSRASPRCRHLRDEVEDRLLRRAVVPRRQRIVGARSRCVAEANRDDAAQSSEMIVEDSAFACIALGGRSGGATAVSASAIAAVALRFGSAAGSTSLDLRWL